MRKEVIWIAAAGLLGLASEASATVAASKLGLGLISTRQDHAQFLRNPHYSSAATRPADPFSASAAEECRAPEPSKLGLLRSNIPSGAKVKSLCRKLRT